MDCPQDSAKPRLAREEPAACSGGEGRPRGESPPVPVGRTAHRCVDGSRRTARAGSRPPTCHPASAARSRRVAGRRGCRTVRTDRGPGWSAQTGHAIRACRNAAAVPRGGCSTGRWWSAPHRCGSRAAAGSASGRRGVDGLAAAHGLEVADQRLQGLGPVGNLRRLIGRSAADCRPATRRGSASRHPGGQPTRCPRSDRRARRGSRRCR